MQEFKVDLSRLVFFALALLGLFFYTEYLEFSRRLILSGQIWRLWTAHFVHVSIQHLLINASAFAILYSLLFSKYKITVLLAVGFVSSLLISLALLSFTPYVEWYNGLSGLLHCLAVLYSLRSFTVSKSWVYLGFAGLISLKVIVEAFASSSENVNQHLGMIVIVEAHLLGVLVGLSLCAILACMPQRFFALRTSSNA